VPEDVLVALGLVAGPVVGASFLAPLFFVKRLSIDRRRHQEIAHLLANRPEHKGGV
jgi:hypothetical protein